MAHSIFWPNHNFTGAFSVFPNTRLTSVVFDHSIVIYQSGRGAMEKAVPCRNFHSNCMCLSFPGQKNKNVSHNLNCCSCWFCFVGASSLLFLWCLCLLLLLFSPKKLIHKQKKSQILFQNIKKCTLGFLTPSLTGILTQGTSRRVTPMFIQEFVKWDGQSFY